MRFARISGLFLGASLLGSTLYFAIVFAVLDLVADCSFENSLSVLHERINFERKAAASPATLLWRRHKTSKHESKCISKRERISTVKPKRMRAAMRPNAPQRAVRM